MHCSALKSDEVSVKAAKGRARARRQRDHHVIGKRVGAETSDAFTDATTASTLGQKLQYYKKK